MSRSAPQPTAQVLLLAEPALAERLERDLTSVTTRAGARLCCVRLVAGLDGPPALIVLAPGLPIHAANLEQEIRALRDRWQPAPLLLLLPATVDPGDWALQLPADGILQDGSATEIRDGVSTLLGGGRVARLRPPAPATPPPGLAQRLLISGLREIDAELALVLTLLEQPPALALMDMLLRGRLRELRAARNLLLWLWGPLLMAYAEPGTAPTPQPPPAAGLAITLRQRSADAIWDAIHARLVQAAGQGVLNHSGRLLALEGLHQDRRTDLILALLEQFSLLRHQLLDPEPGESSLIERWARMQLVVRRQALQQLAGSYVQLPLGDDLLPVADTLIARTDLSLDDRELPDPNGFLIPLVEARPVVVNGQLHAPDDPAAVLHVERLLSDWLVRSAELISGEVLACCAQWPELRRYLLDPSLLPTRNLERIRNRLNAQQRWREWFERPIQLYESRRALFQIQAGSIQSVEVTELRDRELRNLPWPQQLVTLALEARDALAPQLQSLLRSLGDLIVVVLTQVIGRAIGLVGRGIAQGMGRSVGRG